MLFAAAFALFCVACMVLAFVRHPIYGLYFYLSATYVYPPGRWWAYMLGDMRWSLLAAVVTVAAVLFGAAKLRPKPFWLTTTPALILTLYALLMLIQTSWAVDINTHLRGTTQFFKYIVAFWFVYKVVDSEENVRNFLRAHLLGCTLLGLYAYVAGRSGGRLDGVGGPGIDDANTLGMYFATGAITGIGLLLVERGWQRWVSFGCLVFVVNGLILTNTRGAFLGLLAGASVLAMCKAREHSRTFWLLAAIGVLGITVLIDEKFIDRMSTIQEAITDTQDADFSAVSRMTLATAQLEMFHDYPMGSGWRGTATLSPRYLEEKYLSGGGRSSHNTFLTTLVEQGVAGAILYIWLTLWTIRAIFGLRARQRGASPQLVSMAATISGVLAVVFAAGLTADFLMAEVQFWMLAALLATVGLSGVRSGQDPGSVRVSSDRSVAGRFT